jgi:hypothetical protein
MHFIAAMISNVTLAADATESCHSWNRRDQTRPLFAERSGSSAMRKVQLYRKITQIDRKPGLTIEL